jgi:hypothetical protein
VKTALLVVLVVLIPSWSRADQSAGTATQPQSSTADGQTHDDQGSDKANDKVADKDSRKTGDDKEKGDQQSDQSSGRLFGVLPNFLTVDKSSHVPPLTTEQKFNVTVRTTFDTAGLLFAGGLAGIREAVDTDPQFGQGVSGYFKRYGLAFADGTTENFMVNAIFASTLSQDPRYYRMGQGGIWHRAAYSASRAFVTRGDSGRAQFNVSEIGGSGVAAAISDVYRNANDRTVGKTVITWWTQIGLDTMSFAIKEFWPDVRRKL